MYVNDQRNTLIVETSNRLGIPISDLQGKSNHDLVIAALPWRNDCFIIVGIENL